MVDQQIQSWLDYLGFKSGKIPIMSFNRNTEVEGMEFKTRKPVPDERAGITLEMLSNFDLCSQRFILLENPAFRFDPEFMSKNIPSIQRKSGGDEQNQYECPESRSLAEED